jgi:outer membrane protein
MRPRFFLFLLLLPALTSPGVAAEQPRALKLQEARQIALAKHPRISVSELRALAARQVVKETLSAYYPFITANIGGAVSDSDKSRIVTNPLTVSSALDRASGALTVTQIITDFGRTSHLTESNRLKAAAEEQNVEATKAQIVLQVDGAYFAALEAQALLRVADDTVKTRELLRDQISTLAKNKIKSELDASFAEVNYQEALLLRTKSRNDLSSSYASLAALLDEPETDAYVLFDSPDPGSLSANISDLIMLAVNNRPDLRRLRMENWSAAEFAIAEAALSRPTLAVQGAAGVLPWRDQSLNKDYAAAGIVLSWPLFTGGLNTARRKEADLRARATAATLRDEENNVVRDVRLGWIAANNARERMVITDILVVQADKTLALAQARYDAGSSSIIELSQAQLNQTSAAITRTNARYEYLIRRSILDYQTGLTH